ncbi:expressed unknown protein [Seminavis robusta]|uniref:Uncharacterized protein n=1 Tax=Seminavis robusta TaxID=568900 RepID=A0A9N8H4U7_9STRA|nr:expressed unknown protein [Seminavis robusta]|eukprot:Sro58_g033830.1 n/a (942) ;mRNA; r:88860-91864
MAGDMAFDSQHFFDEGRHHQDDHLSFPDPIADAIISQKDPLEELPQPHFEEPRQESPPRVEDFQPPQNEPPQYEQQQHQEQEQVSLPEEQQHQQDSPQFARPQTVASSIKAPPPTSPGASDYTMSGMTAVDGHGMWNSWTRVFDEPKYAMLDLLDNCLDATLHSNIEGKVVMKKLEPNGIVIINNSAKPIKPLKDVLVVYGSTKGVGKNAKRDAIGENGVGLKHGCATLSDANFVITRNGPMYSLGVIAKSLQTKEGVCLPSAWFIVEDVDDKTPGEIEEEFHSHLSNIIAQNPKIGTCVQNALGQGDMVVGLKRLVEHCLHMWDDEWGNYDHIFQVIIASLLHQHNNIAVHSRRSFHGNNPASLFLEEIKQLLPKFYINIPNKGFDFWIGEEKVHFSYWQHRLVEMTKFTVNVPRETPIMDIGHFNWDKEGYNLNIFCGYEALRLGNDNLPNTAQMYIYSRSSGRLIQHDDDARATLGLAASGTDYQQALTIIIDDEKAQLPLMPTKQGIAWSEQKGGETHKRNLLAWTAGIADCYWKYHSNKFKKRCNTTSFKSLMQEQLMKFCDPISRHLSDLDTLRRNPQGCRPSAFLQRSIAMDRLGKADFSHFDGLEWKRSVAPTTKKSRIRRKTYYNEIVPGTATIFQFQDEHYPYVAPKPAPMEWKPPPQPVQQHNPHAPHHPRGLPPMAHHPRVPQPPHHGMRPPPVPMAGAPEPLHKRRRTSGEAMDRPILLLDDDSYGDEGPPPERTRRQVARKSTGVSSAPSVSRPSNDHYGASPSAESQQRIADLERSLAAAQNELADQKRLMRESHVVHRATVQKLTEDLRRVQQQQAQQQNGNQPSQETLQKTRDELMIAKRQRNLISKELQDVKDQREEQVSGLNLEIETLKMRLEQHEETIRRLENSNASGEAEFDDENVQPDIAVSIGWTQGRRSKYHGTDSI